MMWSSFVTMPSYWYPFGEYPPELHPRRLTWDPPEWLVLAPGSIAAGTAPAPDTLFQRELIALLRRVFPYACPYGDVLESEGLVGAAPCPTDPVASCQFTGFIFTALGYARAWPRRASEEAISETATHLAQTRSRLLSLPRVPPWEEVALSSKATIASPPRIGGTPVPSGVAKVLSSYRSFMGATPPTALPWERMIHEGMRGLSQVYTVEFDAVGLPTTGGLGLEYDRKYGRRVVDAKHVRTDVDPNVLACMRILLAWSLAELAASALWQGLATGLTLIGVSTLLALLARRKWHEAPARYGLNGVTWLLSLALWVGLCRGVTLAVVWSYTSVPYELYPWRTAGFARMFTLPGVLALCAFVIATTKLMWLRHNSRTHSTRQKRWVHALAITEIAGVLLVAGAIGVASAVWCTLESNRLACSHIAHVAVARILARLWANDWFAFPPAVSLWVLSGTSCVLLALDCPIAWMIIWIALGCLYRPLCVLSVGTPNDDNRRRPLATSVIPGLAHPYLVLLLAAEGACAGYWLVQSLCL